MEEGRDWRTRGRRDPTLSYGGSGEEKKKFSRAETDSSYEDNLREGRVGIV